MKVIEDERFKMVYDKHASQRFKISLLPVDTRRKLNVHKTFRRRLERLLDVLCTFNVRPVSTGLLHPFLNL